MTVSLSPPPPPPDPAQLANAASTMLSAGAAAITAAVGQIGKLDADAQARLNALLAVIDGQFDRLNAQIADMLGKITAQRPPAPVDAVAALDQIGQAIARAETVLNGQSLVIAKGTVEALMDIKLPKAQPGDPAASVRIAFEIAPKPIA